MDDSNLEQQVHLELEETKKLANGFDPNDLKTGDWFFRLLILVAKSYKKNVRTEYFREKYPEFTQDELAGKLISVTAKYGSIAGGIAGASASADQIVLIPSIGLSWTLFLGTIGTEMMYLAHIQIRLILDLATTYEIDLDPEDPEDVLLVFAYALGIAPADFLGKGLQISAKEGTRRIIKTYISKETLIQLQNFARRIGFKILQRTIIKYAVPIASIAVGSSYNYITTNAIGLIAKSHFKNIANPQSHTSSNSEDNVSTFWQRFSFPRWQNKSKILTTIECPTCKTDILADYSFCPECGSPIKVG